MLLVVLKPVLARFNMKMIAQEMAMSTPLKKATVRSAFWGLQTEVLHIPVTAAVTLAVVVRVCEITINE